MSATKQLLDKHFLFDDSEPAAYVDSYALMVACDDDTGGSSPEDVLASMGVLSADQLFADEDEAGEIEAEDCDECVQSRKLVGKGGPPLDDFFAANGFFVTTPVEFEERMREKELSMSEKRHLNTHGTVIGDPGMNEVNNGKRKKRRRERPMPEMRLS